MSRNWLLELGHTRLKLAPLAAEPGVAAVDAMSLEAFDAWLLAAPAIRGDRFWIAAVTPPERTGRIRSAIEAAGAEWKAISTGDVTLPVAPAYPELGVDRWLAMQPAYVDLQRSFCLVDAGTATTIDLVDAGGRHRGGWILPGISTARAGLLAAAPGLERPDSGKPATLDPARNTAQAIDNGLLLQQIGAVARALAEAARHCAGPPPELVLTGGAAASLQSAFGQARLAPDLVLRGLAMAVEKWRSR